MIKAMLISTDASVQIGGEELIDVWQNDEQTTLWLDLNGVEREQEKRWLERFGCHELAIQDAQRDRHPPKIEVFDDFIFILYRGFVAHHDKLKFEHLQVSMFAGHRLLITCHPKASIAINSLFNKDSAKYLASSPINLALKIFHSSCGNYLKQLFEFEHSLEQIEDKFQLSGNDKMMRELTLYRSHLVKLRRIFNYHVAIGDSLNILVEDEDTDLITEKEVHNVNDLRERLERLLSLLQMYYDICSDLIDGYMSITSHQLNATMRVLTVITALFVPLTFLAGIYGMNFEYIPELKAENGYFILLGVMLVITVVLAILFRRKRWL
ncbi:magnesium transporter CorA family protein [Colwellia sp. MEBiC06753]